MRQYINANSIAVTIRMLRTVFPGSALLVEGDVDARFFKRLIDQQECRVLVCHNRSNVIKVIGILARIPRMTR
jgi:hypothetical protein